MDTFDDYKSIPIGSLVTRERSEELQYTRLLANMPAGIVDLLLSPKSGAFIRGLVRNAALSVESAPQVAFIVLQIAYGEKTLAQLPSMLSTKLQLPNSKAQAMANEIEKELFAPVMLELNQYLAQKKRNQGSMAQHLPPPPKRPSQRQGGINPQNVINLRDKQRQSRPPVPPTPPQAPRPTGSGASSGSTRRDFFMG